MRITFTVTLISLFLSLFFSFLFYITVISDTQAANSSLAQHPSIYLRSHASDTINWQLFNKQAFVLAQQKQKPILLSSGYASCYWCHRMKEDSFKDPAVGKIVNQHFTPILIDRELEVETDQWLQRFMEQQRGFGGWPLTAILTPQGQPIAGFNYTPDTEFTDTLQRFIKDWQQNPQKISEQAKRSAHSIRQVDQNNDDGSDLGSGDVDRVSLGQLLQALLQQLANTADHDYGGFGEREKFPHAPQLNALFELQQLNPDPTLRRFLQTTLAAMIGGSLYDHVGGGFFRYTDDQQWSQPHYEKMLYTQALIAPLLIRAGQTWQSNVYTNTGRNTLQQMIRAFQRKDGYFRSGLSAVGGTGRAGGYYLWTEKQLNTVLGGSGKQKILNLLGEEATLILPFLLTQGESRQTMRAKLLAAQNKRQRQVDDKALTGWNGLVLSALAVGSKLSAETQQSGKQLAAKLLALSQQQTIPQLADQAATDTGKASLTAQVYLAKGLADWGKYHNKPQFLSAARQLLIRIHKRYYRANGWVYSEDNPLLGTLTQYHLPDSQLPSASALWLQTANTLLISEPHGSVELSNELSKLTQEVATQPVKTGELLDEAFFHASYIAESVKQQIIANQQQSVTGATAQ